MADFYEELAAEAVSAANGTTYPDWRDHYEEEAAELVSLANDVLATA